MKSKVNKFTDEQALCIVQEYLTTGISQSELKAKYNFTGNGNLYRWMRKFGLSKPEPEQIAINEVMSKEEAKSPKEKALEARIKQLEEVLRYEQLKNLGLNTMIDIAERELKIDVRKKSGAKR